MKLILIIVLVINNVGCISAFIVSSGKSYEHLTKHSITLDDTKKDLGEPSWIKEYKNPTRIKETVEYRNYKKAHNLCFVWGVNGTVENEFTKYCVVYTREGPFVEFVRGEAHAMAGALTLGIADIIFLPVAIIERYKLSKNHYSITFWFDQNKRYLGYLKGDIRNLEEKYRWIYVKNK